MGWGSKRFLDSEYITYKIGRPRWQSTYDFCAWCFMFMLCSTTYLPFTLPIFLNWLNKISNMYCPLDYYEGLNANELEPWRIFKCKQHSINNNKIVFIVRKIDLPAIFLLNTILISSYNQTHLVHDQAYIK